FRCRPRQQEHASGYPSQTTRSSLFELPMPRQHAIRRLRNCIPQDIRAHTRPVRLGPYSRAVHRGAVRGSIKIAMTNSSPTYSKVPEVTLGFWLIKILATTLGETGGDTVTMTWLKADVMVNSGYLVGSAIFLAFLVALVAAQILATRFNPFLYWTTI